METMGKMLLLLGGGLFLVGLLVVALDKVPGIGRLPGDILIQRGSFTLHIPLVTMLVLSLVLTIIMNIVLRLFRG